MNSPADRAGTIRNAWCLAVLLMAVCWPHAARADSTAVLLCDRDAIAPGSVFRVGIRITLEKGEKTYWKNPGDSGAPPEVEFQLPDGFEAGPLRWRLTRKGRLGPHKVTQHLDLTAGEPVVEATTHLTVLDGPVSYVGLAVPVARDAALTTDIPFGVEPRDVTKEPYGNLERMRENVFWGSGWTAYGDGEKGCALLIGSGMQGFAFDPDECVLSHTLLKVIRHPREGWERHEISSASGPPPTPAQTRQSPSVGACTLGLATKPAPVR